MKRKNHVPKSGALVAAGGAERRAPTAPRPLAGFVTQLLACRYGLPDHRARRRADPEIAAERYAADTVRTSSRLLATC